MKERIITTLNTIAGIAAGVMAKGTVFSMAAVLGAVIARNMWI